MSCANFSTEAEASAAIPSNPQLDRDRDGRACETLPGTGETELHEEAGLGDGDLLDFASVQTLLNRGTVYVLNSEDMPDGLVAASVFRY